MSKVGKKRLGERQPHVDREFFYVIKNVNMHAFFTPEWVLNKGEYGFVSAWRSWAYRVPDETFLSVFNEGGGALEGVIRNVEDKNYLLEFQHEFISSENAKLSRQLQLVVDEESVFKIVPRTLEGFYQVCYILDKIGKEPDAPGVWLVYLLTFFRDDMGARDFARLMYALDFLYFKCADVRQNEKAVIRQAVENATAYIKSRSKSDGSVASDPRQSPIEETPPVVVCRKSFGRHQARCGSFIWD